MVYEAQKLAKVIRASAVQMTAAGGSAHVGSILSCADILAVLFARVIKIDKDSKVFDDRFVLSKGHAGAGVYAALAAIGFLDERILLTHYQNGSILSGHVSHKNVPGIEVSTGSLGHGLPLACGMAYDLLAEENLQSTVYCILGDGECNEGSIWEAALIANHLGLHNLVAIIDRNFLQSVKSTEDTLKLEPLADKWRAFGWQVSIVDGHDCDALEAILLAPSETNTPRVVIAETIKGKGVSFMENRVEWHYRNAQGAMLETALAEIEGMI